MRLPSARRAARRARALELLPDAVLLLDADLRLVDSNGVAHRWLGLPPNADLQRAVHDDDRDLLVAAEAEARGQPDGWSAPVPVRFRHADGSWHTWSVTARNRLADSWMRCVVVLARDITGRPSAAGVAPDVLLRELVSTVPVALLTLDRQGRIRFATGAGMQLEPAGVIGRRLADVVDTVEHRAIVERACRGEPVHEVTTWEGSWWEVRYTPLVHDGALDGSVGVLTDVTARALAEQALTASEAHLRGVLEAVGEGLVVVDADGRTTSANARAHTLLGAAAEVGAPLVDTLAVEHAAAAGELRALFGDDGLERVELRLRTTDRAPVWLLASASPLRSPDDRPLGCVLVLTDITRNKDVERRLAAEARTDPVTGVGSRLTLGDRLEQALARRDGTVAVLFVDVDGLKPVNDAHGHAAGDAVLREVADRMRAALRPADTIVRYGGDEFVVVCDELPDPAEGGALAERVRAAVACPYRLPDDAVLVPTVSIGVATAPPLAGPAALLAAADAAVYAAKAAGRDVVRVAS